MEYNCCGGGRTQSSGWGWSFVFSLPASASQGPIFFLPTGPWPNQTEVELMRCVRRNSENATPSTSPLSWDASEFWRCVNCNASMDARGNENPIIIPSDTEKPRCRHCNALPEEDRRDHVCGKYTDLSLAALPKLRWALRIGVEGR